MLYTIDTSKEIDWQASGNDLKVQNAANLLRTFKYEVGYLRTMGLPRELLDYPISKIRGRLASAIIDQIKEYMPGVTVVSVDIVSASADGNIQVKVVIDI